MEHGVVIENGQGNTESNPLLPSVSLDRVHAAERKPHCQGQLLIPVHMKTLGVRQSPTAPSSEPASEEVKERPDPEKPSAEELASLGIKIRDFAYESKLPPVRTIYLQPRQIQPSAPQTLQREDTQEDDSLSSQSQGARPLERTDTEPLVVTAPPTRLRGFLDLNDYTVDNNTIGSQPPLRNPESQASAGLPEIVFESQDSDTPPINTPTVTPNGSFQWEIKETSDISASQLDAESQALETEIVSHSQVGVPQTAELSSQAASTSRCGSFLLHCSPLTSLPSSPSAPPSPLALRKSTSSILSQNYPSSSHSLKPRTNSNTSIVASPRYNLRKRPISAVSRHSPLKPSKRARVQSVAVHPRPLGKKLKGKETATKSGGQRKKRRV